jgi:hypothetical protein
MKSTVKDCVHKPYCDCTKAHGREICEECKYYQAIDSGFGYCIGLPQVTTVAWCRITCSIFKEGCE